MLFRTLNSVADIGETPMTYDEALKHFRTGRAIGDALRVTGSRVSQCRTAGGFSYPMQCVLEKESSGALVAKRDDDPSQTLKKSA